MFDFIIGNIVNMKEDYIVIQNNGIGYRVYTSINSMMNLEIGKKDQMLYTQLHVREDGLFIYGFTKEEEMDMFNLLLRVSKIGPKIALGVLSTLTPNQIRLAIHNKDHDTLCKAPGIGKKTSERIVVELKDRIGEVDLDDTETIEILANGHDEAIEGLMSLGYSRFEVEKVIRKMDINGMEVEDIIREGLKQLSNS